MARIMDGRKVKAFKKQKNIGLVSFLAELPNFVCMLISAFFANSLVVWMDVVDSFSNIARSGVVALSAHKLQTKKEHKAGFEEKAAILCNSCVLIGIISILYCAVSELFNPQAPSDLMILTILIKIGNTVFDAIILRKQYKVIKIHTSPVILAEFNGFVKDLTFDVSASLIIIICYFLRGYTWSWYISPIVCLIFGIMFAIQNAVGIINKIRTLQNIKEQLSEEK